MKIEPGLLAPVEDAREVGVAQGRGADDPVAKGATHVLVGRQARQAAP